MKNLLLVFGVFLAFGFSSCDAQFGKLLKQVGLEEISTDEIAAGLKEALTKGTSKGSDQLSTKDGFYKSIYKILLPQEAKAVTDKLKLIPGFDKVEENMLEKINRAAEDAAVKAKPILFPQLNK
jgi:Mn-containing catalase